MTGEEIFKKLSIRDKSGSPEDEYARTLKSFHFQAMLHHEEEEFFDLVLQAHNEEKRIIHVWDPRLLIDGTPPSCLSLVPAKRSKGEELFDQLCNFDHLNSEAAEYFETILLLRYQASEDNNDEMFFALLEKAELEEKKLSLPDYGDHERDTYRVSEFILV
ncbi:MAG: hypothetical protein SH818_13200 [Saprospiraceae bacterium]|nr:hypothetical protein [Saprospiraceae bacterium]